MYIPNQDQNVIQHTALIFLGRWSVVLSIIESMASAPDCFRRALIPVSSANLSPSKETCSPLRKQYAFFYARAGHADAENNRNSSNDANLFELGGS